uniref:glutamate synthase (ferredoxin) n=1 Tax=Oryza nivara TaxID=4536 RepID=A0A0E0I559_ORYNI
MATLPRAAAAAAPSPAAALLPLPRAAPLLAGRAAARSAARRLRARGTRAPPLAAARRGWGGVSPRAVLDLPRRREAAEKPAQKAADLNEILSERGACGVGFVANLKNEPSFNIVRDALVALGCMEHRGGCGADNDSGDGSGLMSGIPWDLFNDWANKQGLAPLDRTNTGVGMVFLPQDENSMEEAKAVVAKVFTDEGLEVLGWRTVPFNVSVVGRYAKETMPNIQQIFVKVAKEDNADDIERELYICRKLIERATKSASWADELYFCSLSSRTIVYKGMLRSEILGQFYLDLQNELYKSPFAIYHRRYSTNTSPRWPLAQPMRLLGHNGEINTIQGNLNWMRSREATLQSPVWRGREHEIRPFGDPKASDSANLDSTAELLLRSGRSPAEAMMILVPEAYKNHPTLSIKYPEVIDFYDYYKGQMEAWDGPALLLFSDGRTVGACLDRNGLRPARYWRTSDDFVYVASEVGVIPMDESKVVMKGRLGPGMMITVDLQTGQVLENTEVKKSVASANPYGSWLQQSTRSIKPVNFQSSVAMDNETVLRHQQAFGYSSEDVQMVIETMASQGKEPTFCMGDDIPLAVLSQKPHMLFDYFKQRFAQVTNPAIDPLREGLVMSLEVNIGKRRNILEVGPENADQVTLSSPVLNEGELESLLNDSKLKPKVLSTYFDIRKGLDGSLDKAIKVLCDEADAAVRNGSQLLVLSDRSEALEPTRPAIPILLAVGAIHQHLIQNGLRMSASIVADTAQCFSTHQFACLIGYGASAVCPYLALETCRQWRLSNKTVNLMRNGKMPTVTIEQAQRNFIKAVKSGLLKILSKMGISLLSSYCGAQIFEIYGLGQEVVDLAFCGSVSKIGGLTLDELGRETLSFWVKAFSEDTAKRLENFGFIQSRPGGEYHANNPEMSKLLHKAVREKSDNAYTVYQQHLASRPVNVLRDLLELKSDRAPIPIGKVEPATSIVERFCTGGMSLGAISRETHEAIAIAMNRIGGKSNSGEGGEDPIRWSPLADVEDGYSPTLPHLKGLQNGDTATSAIKQVMMVALELAQLVQSSMLGVLGNLTLIQNGLRERVVLRVDGGFRSGLDVLMAAAMGADEYGFGSVAMIATGCVMARICHTNNCPVGVASQREELRARFPGVPGDLVNYFLFVAEEVRATLAQLGFEKLDDIIGRTDLLKAKHVSLAKTQHIDLKYLLSSAGLPKWSSSQIRSQDVHSNGPVLDETILADPDISDAIENEKEVSKTFPIYNVDRAVCGRVAGVIAKKYGDTGFAGQLNITFTGSAGQSFGCFLTPGMNIRLIGEANDYVGKGMAGGELVVVPVEKTGFVPEDAAIVFVRGKTGERFAVRNSLGQAVVEGTGDHCCEYMTGGCVVVLGKVGRNVAAGMTGGLAYILDEDDTLVPKVNKEIVKMQRVNAPAGQMQLKGLIEAYVEKTGSEKGATILREWEAYLPLFWQLVPPSEEDSPEACAEFERVLAKQATTVQSAK